MEANATVDRCQGTGRGRIGGGIGSDSPREDTSGIDSQTVKIEIADMAVEREAERPRRGNERVKEAAETGDGVGERHEVGRGRNALPSPRGRSRPGGRGAGRWRTTLRPGATE